MKKKPKLSPEDRLLFADAVLNVRPLKSRNTAAPYAAPPKIRTQTFGSQTFDEEALFSYPLSDAHDDQHILGDEIISYQKNSIQQRTLRNLRAGKLIIDDRLDLHGLTIEQARQVVSQFILDCQLSNKKCVIVVHGKGSTHKPPRLKSMINHWLPQIPDVLAFCSAQRQHGGSGAVYILLKTKKY